MYIGRYLTAAHVPLPKYKTQTKAYKTHSHLEHHVLIAPYTFFCRFFELSLVKWLLSFYTNMHRHEFKKKPVQNHDIPNW